ncbi:pilus assembly protein PilM [Oxalicibacterium faecigallinarum]|uniref:Fimbrial assembly protein n=1 Tax=Oxalicibacterium faecigallinarum TaxID=573741 RepID=A0A8J3F3K6_9BURK|nr:pilus assembly protein PilM [Oxalicibacterium faecigallinarum]GGI19570.1 fimbrial assembly protein [Oxalicibacterium faecigallinarum]
MAFDFGALFGRKSPPLIGLDISSSGVKLVELSEAGKSLKLECFASEPLPRGAVVDGNIENIDQVSDAIARAWRKSGTRVKLVAMGMPPASVITKKITLPSNLSEENLELQVETEASQYIPFALDEVRLDFDVIGPVENSPDDVDVMLAATRKEKVEDRVAVAEAAGLKPTVMDIESYAARAAIDRIARQKIGKGQILAAFQIGTNVMHVSILQDGELIYEREQPFGGHQLTQDIVRNYGFSYEEAEIKKKSGDLPDGYQKEILEPFLENAAQEVTRAIQFFFTSTPYSRVDQIYLAGGCANIPQLVETVATRTKISTSVISPFAGMQLGSNVREKQLRIEAPAYLVACGLAMRRFDQ